MSHFTPLTASWRNWLAIALAGTLYLCIAGFYVERGCVNADEGFYAYASYAVMHGKVPYRDFAYTQAPVLPYLQGAVMSLTGFGVRQERWINACLGALAVAIGAAMWRKSKLHPLACTALILAWCFCKPLIYYDTIGKTYAMSQLLLVAAGGSLLLNASPRTKLFLLSLLGVLAVGCRLTAAPSVFILWCGFVALHPRQLSWTLLLGIPLTITLVVLGPFFAADPVNALFWNWTYHLQSTVPLRRSLALLQSFGMAPSVTILVAVSIGIFFRKGNKGLNTTAGAWLFLAGLAGWLLGVGLPGVYDDYAIPFMPLTLAGCGLLLSHVRISAVAWGVGGLVLLAATTLELSYIQKGYLEGIDDAAAYVKMHTKPTDIVLSSMPEIPLEAERPVFPRLEMGKFALTAEMDEKTAQRRNIITFNQLLSAIDMQSAPLVVLSRIHTWNFGWSIPCLMKFKPSFYLKFSGLLLQRYDCVYANDYFLIFKIHDPKNKIIKLDAHVL